MLYMKALNIIDRVYILLSTSSCLNLLHVLHLQHMWVETSHIRSAQQSHEASGRHVPQSLSMRGHNILRTERVLRSGLGQIYTLYLAEDLWEPHQVITSWRLLETNKK